jgi:hypothetical protein
MDNSGELDYILSMTACALKEEGLLVSSIISSSGLLHPTLFFRLLNLLGSLQLYYVPTYNMYVCTLFLVPACNKSSSEKPRQANF